MHDGWRQVPFASLYALPSRNGLMAPKRVRGSGVSLVNMREIFAFDMIGAQEMELAPLPERNQAEWLLAPGDLLFARQSLTLAGAGKVALVLPAVRERTFESHIIRVRLDPKTAEPSFYYYFFRSRIGRALIESVVEQVAAAGVRASDLGRLRVPQPSREEQRRISAVLTRMDDLIDADRSLMAALEQRVFAECARAAATATSRRPFGELATRIRCQVNPQRIDGEMPYLGLEHFAEDAGGLAGVGSASSISSAALLFGAGDVLYGKLRPYFRKVARPGFGGVCTSEAWVLRPRAGTAACYLHWIAASRGFTEHASAGSEGTRMPRSNWAHVAAYTVPVPDGSTMAELDELLEPLWRLYWELFDESRTLARVRDELLPLVMSGRVGVAS